MGIAKWELPNGNIAKWDTFKLFNLAKNIILNMNVY